MDSKELIDTLSAMDMRLQRAIYAGNGAGGFGHNYPVVSGVQRDLRRLVDRLLISRRLEPAAAAGGGTDLEELYRHPSINGPALERERQLG